MPIMYFCCKCHTLVSLHEQVNPHTVLCSKCKKQEQTMKIISTPATTSSENTNPFLK